MTQNRKSPKADLTGMPGRPVPPHPVSPLAPKRFTRLLPLAGVTLAAGEAGVRYKHRTDVMLAIFAPGTKVAGVFTTSKTASAPVDWCKAALTRGSARALVVNSGNANAFTGKAGLKGAGEVAMAAARAVGCDADEVYMASTGVIGSRCRRARSPPS
jgi:glutamate N-acetyltransferase / amino-acid N-acetyltransferase